MVRTMQATGETGLMNGRLLQYLDPDDENNTLYRTTGEQTTGKLETVTADARQLVEIAGEAYGELKEYQQLKRVIEE